MHRVGTVQRFDPDRGFGFLHSPQSSADVFFHVRDFDRRHGPPTVGMAVATTVASIAAMNIDSASAENIDRTLHDLAEYTVYHFASEERFMDANHLAPEYCTRHRQTHAKFVAQVQEWLRSEGVPAFAVLPKSDAFVRVEAARDAWLAGAPIATLASASKSWSAHEWIHFVDALPRTLTPAQMRALDGQFGFTKSGNSEIAHAWFRLAIATRYTQAYAAMEDYMVRIGRRKLILPLYRDLAATPEGKAQLEAAADPSLSPEWPVSISIEGWTSYTKEQIIACKGPGE